DSARRAASAPTITIRPLSVAATRPRTRPRTLTSPSCPPRIRSGSSPWIQWAFRAARTASGDYWSARSTVTDANEMTIFGADDIAIVVNSHLHFDHAGNNGAFPKATFVVQGDHLAFAKGKPNFPGVYWDIPELSYLPVAGRARVAPGLEVVPTPGHAPGHQSLVVDLAETGRVVLCGDAAFTRLNLERREIKQPDEAAAK